MDKFHTKYPASKKAIYIIDVVHIWAGGTVKALIIREKATENDHEIRKSEICNWKTIIWTY